MKRLLLTTMVCVLGLFGNLRAQEADTLSIGSGEEKINYAPTYVDKNYSLTQQIFVAEDLQNKIGKITGVAFKCVKRNATRTFKVYMACTNKTYFNKASDWVAVTEQDKVYEGEVTFTEGEWTFIDFQTPFVFGENDNVVLCINDVTGSWLSLITQYASETKTENRMIYSSSYDDALDATTISSNGTLSANINQVKFVLVEGDFKEDIELTAPTNLVATPASTSSITLTWGEVENATTYNVYRADELVANVADVNYTDENLESNTEYCYTVTAVNGSEESEKSEEECVKTLEDGIEELVSKIEVYPNPVENELLVSSEEMIEKITIYTVTGAEVFNAQCEMKEVKLNVSEFNSGVYFVKIKTTDNEMIQRIVKK